MNRVKKMTGNENMKTILNSPDNGYTDHGSDRANDPTRDVGSAQDVIDRGKGSTILTPVRQYMLTGIR